MLVDASGGVDLIRPNGLIERMPVSPAQLAISPYARPAPGRTDDRRRRPRPAGQPWRGRLVDRLV